jgi:hypothetical protein
MANQIEWVGIPAMSLDRAIRLHSTGRGAEVEKNGYPAMTAGRTPHKGCGAGGLCAFAGDKVRPSRDGPLAHLGARGRMCEAVEPVVPFYCSGLSRNASIPTIVPLDAGFFPMSLSVRGKVPAFSSNVPRENSLGVDFGE